MGIGTFGPHGLILCVPEGYLSELLCVYNVDIETFDLHGLILYVSVDYLFLMLCMHTVNIDTFHEPL